MAYRAHGGSKKLPAEGQALLEWFQAIANPGAVLRVEDLVDGQLIWTVLQRIRPEEFLGPLPSQDDRNWLSNWQNLKHVYNQLTSYVTNEAGRLPSSFDGLDTQALARDMDVNSAMKLLKMVLFTALNADDNAPYISPMYELGSDQQKLVQQTIMEMQDMTDGDDAQTDAKPGFTGDKDLYYEEQLARLSRENDTLLRSKNDLMASLREQTDRNARLTQNNTSLQEKLSSLQDQLGETSGRSIGGSVLKEIESKMKEQEDHIAFQEQQLTDLQKLNEDLQRESTRLRDMEVKFQPLQDAYDVMNSEREALVRKANAMDKYKAKLQTLADLEKENEALRSAMDELREVNKDGNQAMESAKAFQRQIDEMSRMIPTIEQELFESRMMKQQLDANAQDLRKQLENANSRYEQDQATIKDLLEQVQSGSSHPGGPDNLGDELDDEPRPRPKTEKEHADMQKVNKELTTALNEGAIRYQALEGMLAAAKSRIKKLETQVEEGYTSKNDNNQFAGSYMEVPQASAVADLMLRNQQRKEQEDAELKQERSLIGLEGAGADSGQPLVRRLNDRADEDKVVLVDKDELNRMRGFEARAAKSEELRARTTELETQNLHYRDLIRHMTAVNGADSQNEGANTPLSPKQKHSDQLISSLKAQLDILKRENKLVASAFFDLSSRLQLNNVSLQRRSEAPRSFLNKQRALVAQATAVRAAGR